MRRAARTDRNHASIRDGLRRIPGVTVADTSGAGDGFPDIVAGYAGINTLLEIKDGSKPPSHRRLKPAQVAFRDSWRGQYAVVTTLDEAIQIVCPCYGDSKVGGTE